jgi:hypothetical protein
VVGSCERSNEPSGFVKGGLFLDDLSDCYLFMKVIATLKSKLWDSV